MFNTNRIVYLCGKNNDIIVNLLTKPVALLTTLIQYACGRVHNYICYIK